MATLRNLIARQGHCVHGGSGGVAAPDLEVGAVTAFCSRGRVYAAVPNFES
jgi:hypothetical protein